MKNTERLLKINIFELSSPPQPEDAGMNEFEGVELDVKESDMIPSILSLK